MLIDCSNPIIQIYSVGSLKWGAGKSDVKARNYAALAIRIKGNANFTTGNHAVSVLEKDVLYIPQGLGYITEYTDTEIFFFHFRTLNTDKNLEVYSPKNKEEILKLFILAKEAHQSKEPERNAEIYFYFYKILSEIKLNEASFNKPDYLISAVNYMQKNFTKSDLSVAEICKKNLISETAFRKEFLKSYHCSPLDYITDLRLNYAISLIVDGCSVRDAAFVSGYNDEKYFSRIFKKKLRKTPSEYKNYGK